MALGVYAAWKGVTGDERMYSTYWNGTDWGGSQQEQITTGLTSIGPSIAAYQYPFSVTNRLYMAWKGVTGDERMYYSYYDGNNWEPQKFAVGMTSVGPSLAVFNNRLYMAWKGVTGDERMYYSYFDGNNWEPQKFAVGMTSVGPSLAVFTIQEAVGDTPAERRLYMVWKGITGDERMYYSYFDGNNWVQQQLIAIGMTSYRPSLS